MNYIKEEYPNIARSFYQLTGDISEHAPFDEKMKELILCAVFASHDPSATRGLGLHVERALELGASREEILGVILLAMPVVGITRITNAIDKAEEILQQQSK